MTNSPQTMAGPRQGRGRPPYWSLGRRGRWSGTTASWTSWSKLSVLLCCRRWNSCQMSFSSLPRINRWFPSRLSQCRRSYPLLLSFCSGLWSWPFQFLVVEGETLVFKVFFPDRVQHRGILRRNAFLSGLWGRSYSLLLRNIFLSGLCSRSSIFPVEAFKIFDQDKVHLLLRTFQLVFMKMQMSLVNGFFALFPKIKKVRHYLRTRGRNSSALEPMDAGSL